MTVHLLVEVVTRDPSDVKIFEDGKLTKKEKFVPYLESLGERGWKVATSHGYVKDGVVYEKYVFVLDV